MTSFEAFLAYVAAIKLAAWIGFSTGLMQRGYKPLAAIILPPVLLWLTFRDWLRIG